MTYIELELVRRSATTLHICIRFHPQSRIFPACAPEIGTAYEFLHWMDHITVKELLPFHCLGVDFPITAPGTRAPWYL